MINKNIITMEDIEETLKESCCSSCVNKGSVSYYGGSEEPTEYVCGSCEVVKDELKDGFILCSYNDGEGLL